MGQGVGVRDPDRRAVRKRDHRLQRIDIKSRQGLTRHITQMRGNSDVVHGSERMVGCRWLVIVNIDSRAGDAACSQGRY